MSEVTTLWQDYQNGLDYQVSSGLAKKLPMFVKFYEGEQWAAATERTKNLPRPVINVIKMICRNKKSAILSTPVKIVYKAERDDADVERFNRFASYIQKELGQDGLDKKAIDDAVKKGSYFYHYYWDSEARGKEGIKEGGLRCEIIDPLSIFFADPTQTDEQKQEWIIIASREPVKSVQAKCDEDIDPEEITADENEDRYDTVEQDGAKLCTVLTRYFRKNGEVYCEQATKSVIIRKAFPITPDLENAGKVLGIEGEEEDAPNNDLPDNHKSENLNPDTVKASLYPIVVGNYEFRERSIYGLGEVEGLIPNQKAINHTVAMNLLNIQEFAWGKWIVAPNALKGQKITNDPAQVLIDHTGTQQGIRKATEQVMQSQPLNMVNALMETTRVVTGSTEVMTGETIGAGMSGAAIAQLQAQAQLPVEELKDSFWLTKEKQGKVLAQFFKLFYQQKEFSYTEEISSVDEYGKPTMEDVTRTDIFNGSDYGSTDFEVVVETTAGTKASAAGDINALDTLFAKGAISLKTYIKAYPEDALSNRTKLLKGIEEDEQGQVNVLTQQLNQATAMVEQQAKQLQEQQASIDKVVALIRENQDLKQFIANIYTEAKGKIMLANEVIKANQAQANEATMDASMFANHIAQTEGIKQVAPASK